jgi:1-acyl-sn-glycerol-3-phosphate acyltransferase
MEKQNNSLLFEQTAYLPILLQGTKYKTMIRKILPVVPPHHLGKRSLLSRKLAHLFLRLSGWRVTGKIPEHRRIIVVTGPHTSNWDFVYGLTAALAMNMDIHWLGKNTLFNQPLTRVMYWLGGIPIDRSNPQGIAQEVADTIRDAVDMALIITPEGTRSKVSKMKTGFVRIASMSDSVMLITTLDYPEKIINLGEVMTPSGDPGADVKHIQNCFAQVTPKHPHNH